jgi:hypothetical protein
MILRSLVESSEWRRRKGGENLGFSTIFSTVVEIFGGRPYWRRREGNVTHGPGDDKKASKLPEERPVGTVWN